MSKSIKYTVSLSERPIDLFLSSGLKLNKFVNSALTI